MSLRCPAGGAQKWLEVGRISLLAEGLTVVGMVLENVPEGVILEVLVAERRKHRGLP